MKKIILFSVLCFGGAILIAAGNPFLKLENRVIDYFEDTNLSRIFSMSFDDLPRESMKNFDIDWDDIKDKEDLHFDQISSAAISIYSHDYICGLKYPKGLLRRIQKDGWQKLDQDNEDESNTVLFQQRAKKGDTYLACLILTEEKLILLEIAGRESEEN